MMKHVLLGFVLLVAFQNSVTANYPFPYDGGKWEIIRARKNKDAEGKQGEDGKVFTDLQAELDAVRAELKATKEKLKILERVEDDLMEQHWRLSKRGYRLETIIIKPNGKIKHYGYKYHGVDKD